MRKNTQYDAIDAIITDAIPKIYNALKAAK